VIARHCIVIGIFILVSAQAFAQLGIRTAVSEGETAVPLSAAERRELIDSIAEKLEKAAGVEDRRRVLDEAGIAGSEVRGLDLGSDDLDPAQAARAIVNRISAQPVDCLDGFAPVRSQRESECFWRQQDLSTLRGARIVGSDDRSTAALEIVSGLMGQVRFDIATSLTSGSTGDAEDAADRRVNQLLANGGNFAIRAMYPVYARATSVGGMSAVAYGRAGAIFDWLGEELAEGTSRLGETDASLELGIDADLEFGTSNDEIVFSLFGRLTAVHGTEPFHVAIGNGQRSLFLLANAGLGIRLNKLVTVSLSGRWFALDESIPSDGPMVSLVLTPAPKIDTGGN
jgi:hypothetical protein